MITAPCAHYWIIDPPEGKKSWGTCQYCGERRQFNNTAEEEEKEYWARRWKRDDPGKETTEC